MTENELAIVRRAYAKQIMAADRPVVSQQVEDAFAAIPREHFLMMFTEGPQRKGLRAERSW